MFCSVLACVPQWSVTNNTHAGKGNLISGLTTAADCENGCLDEPTCKGYDLDFNGIVSTLCWFHYSENDFLSNNLRRMDNTYLHRIIDRCPSSSTTGTLPNPIIYL